GGFMIAKRMRRASGGWPAMLALAAALAAAGPAWTQSQTSDGGAEAPPDRALVTGLRFISSKATTRILLELSQEAKYEIGRLAGQGTAAAALHRHLRRAPGARLAGARAGGRRSRAPGAPRPIQRRRGARGARSPGAERAQDFFSDRALSPGGRAFRAEDSGARGGRRAGSQDGKRGA